MKQEIVSLLTEKPAEGLTLLDPTNPMTKWVKEYTEKYGELPLPELFNDEFFPEEEVTPTAPWSYYKEKLEKAKLIRDLQPAFDLFSKKYIDSPYEASRALIDKVVLLNNSNQPTLQVRSIKDGKERWEKFASPKSKRVMTGIPPLDEASGGISCDDEFMVISARLGVGKSWTAHFMASYMATRGCRVGIYSGEMSEEQVGGRLDSILTHISNYELTRGKYKDFDILQKAWDGVKGDIVILTIKHLGRMARPSDIRHLVKNKELDVIILDQLSLMTPDGKPNRDDVRDRAELSMQLKALQQELRIPIIAVSQLNRQAEGQEATAANLSGSDRIGQDATLVLGLSKVDRVLKIKVMKSRDFKLPEKAWEFTWDIDRGYLTPQKSKIDAVKAAVRGAKDKDREHEEEDEDII